MAAIVVEELRKAYGPREAVRGLSFRVEAGEVFALLGPNGAGKTTTVEILEGFRRRDAGRVAVLGLDPQGDGPRLRARVGIVLQECGIEELLTVREALARQAGYFAAPRPVGEVLERVELADRADARIRTLSGGQRRRLDLALALIGDPELIFLDEPTTGFDPAARRNAWALVKALCGRGKTVLLTTHYMEEAQALADRVAVIVGGRLVAEGTPDTIGGRHASATLIRFRLPAGTGVRTLPLPAAVVDGDAVEVRTETPTRDLHALTAWALGAGADLEALTVTPPSLEDVYLQLVREAEA